LGEKKKQMTAELGEKKKQETTEEVNKPAEKSKGVADQGGELNGQGRPSASIDVPYQGNGLRKLNFVRRNKRKRGELTAQDVARRQGQRLASNEITDQVKLMGQRTRGAVPNPGKPSPGNGLRKVNFICMISAHCINYTVMGSSPENSLLQKCRERLRTIDPKRSDPSPDPTQARATCTGHKLYCSILTFVYIFR
jgi:hypothetical protein